MTYRLLNRKKRNKKERWRKKIIVIVTFIFVIIGCICLAKVWNNQSKVENLTKIEIPEWIDQQIISIDGVSRNGKSLNKVKDIVIHYVGNPGSTAQQNHDFYTNESSTVSSHFIVGLKGEIIQCIPLNEMSAASNWRNVDTISIEVCHPDSTGKFNKKTYNALVKLTAWLKENCDLNKDSIIRHYDITGKECPRYFVQHEDKWIEFIEDVEKYYQREK